MYPSSYWKNNTHFDYFYIFPLIYRPKMETKTCQFRTISDSATRSTSWRQFFKIHFGCRESLTLLPFKPLILTPPAKIVDNCLLLRFLQQFFAYTSLTSSENWKTKNFQSEQYVNQFLYSKIGGQKYQKKDHGDTVSKKPRDIFLCLLQINIKNCAMRGSLLQATCGLPEKNEISTQM